MIKREKYLQQIQKELSVKDTILFLIGARQVGKSTLLESLFDFEYLSQEETLLISGDKIATIWFSSSDDFLAYFKLDYDFSKIKSIIIDEAQYITNIGIILKNLIDEVRAKKQSWKIIVSGSGSLNVFKWMTDSLIGRKKIIHVFPFSFEEFCLSKWILSNTITPPTISRFHALFSEYLRYGWYPRVVLATNSQEKKEILAWLVNDYIFKDVMLFLQEKDIVNFKTVLKTIATHVCSLTSVWTIAQTIGIGRYTLEKYFWILENTFLLTPIRSFVWGKTTGEIKKMLKFYFNDIGILRFLLGLSDREGTLKGQVIENYVANELFMSKKEYETIYFRHTKSGAEVDFIRKDELDGRLTPLEVKSSDHLRSGKSLLSFCNLYKEKVQHAYVTTEKQRKKAAINETIPLDFLPYLTVSMI